VRKVKTKWVLSLAVNCVPQVKLGNYVVVGQSLALETVKSERIVNLPFDLKKYENQLIGKQIKQGEVVAKTGGLFSKKIIAPCDGTISRIDEFNNLYVTTGDDIKKPILSPVDAKVVMVENDKIELEFKANEYVGVGLNENKAWATRGLKFGKVLGDLNVTDDNKVLVVDKISAEMLAKAEVVGVKGVVVYGEQRENIYSKLPILKIGVEEWNLLKNESKMDGSVLLSAGNGRLLLVI
jgi:hypothetical protein